MNFPGHDRVTGSRAGPRRLLVQLAPNWCRNFVSRSPPLTIICLRTSLDYAVATDEAMAKVPVFDPISFLMKRRFPFFGLSPMGKRYPSATSIFHDPQEVEAYRAELARKPQSELNQLVEHERRAEEEEIKRKLDEAEQARFFHQPNAQADFDHYCKCSYWTVDEAIALSFGKNPQIVNWATVAPYVPASKFAPRLQFAPRSGITRCLLATVV